MIVLTPDEKYTQLVGTIEFIDRCSIDSGLGGYE